MGQPDVRPAKPHGLSLWWLLVLVAVAAVLICGITLMRGSARQPQWSLSQVAEAAQEGKIARIDVSDTDEMTVTLKDGSTVYSAKDPSSTANEQLETLGVSPDRQAAIDWSTTKAVNWAALPMIGVLLLPLVVFVGVIAWLLIRAARNKPPQNPQ